MAEERPAILAKHQILIENRETITMTGIEEVLSFDETETVLRTALGDLTLRGSGFKMLHTDSSTGELAMQGEVADLLLLRTPPDQGARGAWAPLSPVTALDPQALLPAFLAGAACAAGYDPLLALRRVLRPPLWVVSLLDLLYFFLLSLVSYSFFLLVSAGEVRMPLLFAGLLGAFCWRKTLGRAVCVLWRAPFYGLRLLLRPVGFLLARIFGGWKRLLAVLLRPLKKLRRIVENLLAKHRAGSV